MAEVELPPQVEKFIEYGVSEAFSTLLAQFYSENCKVGVWENFELEGEQTLERGSCYQQYQLFVDQRLDEFCRAEGFSAAEVAEQIQQAKDSAKAIAQHEFLPSFIQSMDYGYFGKQMREQAVRMVRQTEAFAIAPDRRASFMTCGDFSALPVDISGVWKAHATYQEQVGDSAVLEEFLKALGCPWFARKILKHASYFVKNIVIIQNEADVSFTYQLLFFGTTSVGLSFGANSRIPNLWQKMISINTVVDPAQNCIASTMWDEDYFQGTSHTGFWHRTNRPDGPGDMLILTDYLQGVPDGLGGRTDVQFQQFFIREDAPQMICSRDAFVFEEPT